MGGIPFCGALLLAALSQGASASNPLPALKIVDHVKHYTVTGNTALSIRKQLANRSESGQKPRHGSTSSTFEVVSKLELVEGWCRVLHQEVLVEITTELPRWEPGRKPDAALQKEWNESLARLDRHEAGHRQNVIQAAEALRESLVTLAPEQRCMSARASIDLELRDALNRLARRDAYYDRLTRNGLRDLPGEAGSSTSGDAEDSAPRRRRMPESPRKLPVE